MIFAATETETTEASVGGTANTPLPHLLNAELPEEDDARIRRGRQVAGIAVHDFDELGVPEGADRHWCHRMTEMCVRREPEYQDRGIDLLLTGQSPWVKS